MRVQALRRGALILACLGGTLAIGACAATAQSDETPQQAQVQKARQLCLDLGYKAATTEFAQCAQSEYDRIAAAAPSPAQSDDWFERWIHRPPVCQQRACGTW